MARLKIPYESLDPLTIGAADDESKTYRDEARPRDPGRESAGRHLPGGAGGPSPTRRRRRAPHSETRLPGRHSPS